MTVKINIGDLKHRIIIQKIDGSIQNENGFEKPNWIDYTKAWASVKNLYGNEYYSAKAAQLEKTVKFTIRYRKDIDETMRIIYGKKIVNDIEVDRVFTIDFIDDIDYKHEFMEIKAISKL